MDRRTVAPSLVVVAIMILLVGVFPAIDRSLEHARQIAAGDVVLLGSGLSFVPATGWGFPHGTLASDAAAASADADSHLDATLVDGAVRVNAITGPFRGSPEELIANAKKLNEAFRGLPSSSFIGDPVTIVTDSGMTGVSQRFAGVNVEGFIATFVVDGTGVEFVVSGPADALDSDAKAIADMIASLDRAGSEDNQ